MRDVIWIVLISLLAASAPGYAGAAGDETSTTDQATDKVQPAASADATKPDELQLPPGFKVKKRGDVTLYCLKGKATGTRFQTEACYDEDQLRDYLLAREQNNRDFDQARSVCQTASVCRVE